MAGLYRNEYNGYYYDAESVVSTLVLVLFLSDFTLGTLLIVRGHKKNLNLLRAYYFYSICLCLLTFLLTAALVCLSAQGWLSHNVSVHTWTVWCLDFTGYFVDIALQAYFVLLLRREIINRNKCLFTFTNEAAGGWVDVPTMKHREGETEKCEKDRVNQKICHL